MPANSKYRTAEYSHAEHSHTVTDYIGITGASADSDEFARKLSLALHRHGSRSIRLLYRDRPLLAQNAHEWQSRWQLVLDRCAGLHIPTGVCASTRLPPPPPDRPAGLHLSATELMQLAPGSLPTGWSCISASCHNRPELEQAQRLGLDYACISPILPPEAHPSDLPPLQMDGLRRTIKGLKLPVYALGGVSPANLAQVRQMGARGVAGISWFWPPQQQQQ